VDNSRPRKGQVTFMRGPCATKEPPVLFRLLGLVQPRNFKFLGTTDSVIYRVVYVV